MFKGYISFTKATAFALLIKGLRCVGGSCYVACVLRFIGDQMIGASGEQLSFAMYWLMSAIVGNVL